MLEIFLEKFVATNGRNTPIFLGSNLYTNIGYGTIINHQKRFAQTRENGTPYTQTIITTIGFWEQFIGRICVDIFQIHPNNHLFCATIPDFFYLQ